MLTALKKLWSIGTRTSSGQPVSDAPPVARLRAPELKADTLGYAGRHFLRGLTPQRLVTIFESADRYIADQIALAAEIEESDDHINGTLELRRQAVLRLDTLVGPGDPDDQHSLEAAELAGEIVDAPWFYDAREWLLRATLQQWTAVELLYEQQGLRDSGIQGFRGNAAQSLNPSIPQFLWMPIAFRPVEPERWHFEQVEDDGDPVPLLKRQLYTHGEYVEPTAGKFVIHAVAAVAGQPGRHAKIRAIAKLWFLGRLALTEWGGLIDSWFQPFTHVTYQQGMSAADVQTMVESFLNLASRKVVATPEGTTLTMHDVPDQTPHKDFQDFVRRSISKLLLGQETSQQALAGQETGATLQGEVRDDVRDADARLLDASLNESLFTPWCAWNYGPDVAPPRIKHVIHETLDPEQRSRIFEAAQRLRLKLESEQVYGDLNLNMPEGTPKILLPPAPTFGPPGAGLGFGMPFDKPPAPTERGEVRAPEGEEPALPVESEAPLAAEKVQDTALAGVQIESLMALLQSIADGTQSDEVVLLVILEAFPMFDEQKVRAMVDAAQRFSRSHPAPSPAEAAAASRRIVAARGDDPIRDLAGVFEGHLKAVRKLGETVDSGGGGDQEKAQRFRERLPELLDEFDTAALQELLDEVTFGAYALGRLRMHDKEMAHSAHGRPGQEVVVAAGELERGRFQEALDMMLRRTDVLTKDKFLQLQGMNRARAWTVARVADQQILGDLHAAVSRALEEGQTYRDFLDSLNAIMEQRGWTGLDPWHAKVVYEQNVGMAYSAGRCEQAQDAGVKHWRKLPSTSANPRLEHARYNGQVFSFEQLSPPPWDFGCNCPWEVVFEDELQKGELARSVPDFGGQGFQFSPADYFKKLMT